MAVSTGNKLTLIDRALRRLGYVRWRPSSVIHKVESPLVGAWGPAPDPAWGQSAQYAGVYMSSPWVYVAVNRIAEAAALVPFRVFTSPPQPPSPVKPERGESGATSPVAGATTSPARHPAISGGEIDLPEHPFVQLLRFPNPLMSRFELIEATVGQLEIHGNAYWFLAGEPGGTPQEI